MLRYFKVSYCFLTAVFLFVSTPKVKAYSILTHEAIIDASWKNYMVPLIKQKYPLATRKELLLAHSYAYGGSIVADMGYMPFGNGFFTDLLHYVRSGDFVETLIKDAQNLNEYAFALGALSHYMADKYGHSMSTNLNVPLVYPGLQQKFGNVVTYADDHTSHSRMEFSYDALQIGEGNYTSQGYHDFIGFNIAISVLEKAFYETYGQELGNFFSNINSSINTLRWGVRNLFPVLTKAAYKANKAEIQKLHPGMTARQFKYKLSRRSYNLQYGKEYKESKFFTRVIVFIIGILPKVGPLKTLKFQSPGEEGQKLFANGFKAIVANYHTALNQLGTGQLTLPDINFDTGERTTLGAYVLADNTYGILVQNLKDQDFKNITPQLQRDIVNFYNTADTAKISPGKPEVWARLSLAVKQIKNLQPLPQDSLKTLVKPD